MRAHKPMRCHLHAGIIFGTGEIATSKNQTAYPLNATAIPDGYVLSDAVVEAFLSYCVREEFEHYCVHRDDIRASITAALAQIAKEAS